MKCNKLKGRWTCIITLTGTDPRSWDGGKGHTCFQCFWYEFLVRYLCTLKLR